MKNGEKEPVGVLRSGHGGPVRVAQALADGKMEVTVADLDRLIRLEEFLREDLEKDRIQVVFNWTQVDKDGNVVTRTEYPPAKASEED